MEFGKNVILEFQENVQNSKKFFGISFIFMTISEINGKFFQKDILYKWGKKINITYFDKPKMNHS